MEVSLLESVLAKRDVIEASRILDECYRNWDTLEKEEKSQICELESVYLTMVSAQLLAD